MSLESIVQTLGLPGVVIGTALEGEGVAFLSGVFAHRHIFHFEAAALSVMLGALITDNITFGLGRFGGRLKLVQKAMANQRVSRVREMIDRHQTKACLAFRFIYGLKTVAPLLLGSSSVSWARYALLDFMAVTVWAHLFVALGYFVGTAITQLFGKLKLELHTSIALLVFVGFAVVVWFLFGRKFRRRSPAE